VIHFLEADDSKLVFSERVPMQAVIPLSRELLSLYFNRYFKRTPWSRKRRVFGLQQKYGFQLYALPDTIKIESSTVFYGAGLAQAV
jgi:hypothetical protein